MTLYILSLIVLRYELEKFKTRFDLKEKSRLINTTLRYNISFLLLWIVPYLYYEMNILLYVWDQISVPHTSFSIDLWCSCLVFGERENTVTTAKLENTMTAGRLEQKRGRGRSRQILLDKPDCGGTMVMIDSTRGRRLRINWDQHHMTWTKNKRNHFPL